MKTHLSATFVTLLFVSASGCSGKPPVVTPNKEPSGETATAGKETQKVLLQSEFERELEQIPASSTAKGGDWSAQVAGNNVRVEPGPEANVEALQFNFEPSIPTTCYVYPAALDPAVTLGQIVESTRKTVKIDRFVPTKVAVEQEFPVYFASVYYHKDTEKGTLIGQLKLALTLHTARPMLCVHDAPGYTATFEKVVRGLLASYQTKTDAPAIATSISVARIGDIPIEFGQTWVRKQSNGATEEVTVTARIVPRSPTELMVTDSATVRKSEKSQITQAHFVENDLQGEKMNLTLTRTAKGKYKATGSMGAKPIDVAFAAKEGLPDSDATSTRIKQQIAKGTPFKFSQLEYTPSVDPTSALEIQYAQNQGDSKDTVRALFGQFEIVSTVDGSGEPVKSEMKAASQSIVHERLYSRDDRKKAHVASR